MRTATIFAIWFLVGVIVVGLWAAVFELASIDQHLQHIDKMLRAAFYDGL